MSTRLSQAEVAEIVFALADRATILRNMEEQTKETLRTLRVTVRALYTIEQARHVWVSDDNCIVI